METTIKELTDLIIKSSIADKDDFRKVEIKDANRTIYRMFYPSSRYLVDCAPDFKGWEQFDTYQDAPYFGVWSNKELKQSLCYAEGDWVLVQCTNEESYLQEVKETIEFYNEMA